MYPLLSVATTGTHDTEALRVWWEGAPEKERRAVLAIPSVLERLDAEDAERAIASPVMSHGTHDALLESLYASTASLLLLPIQDVFGWSDRINQPATVSDANWTWRLPWPVERMASEPEALARAAQLAEWCARYGR